MTRAVTEGRDINTCCNGVLDTPLGLYKGSKMVKRAFSILAVTAAAGIALTPVAASAATRPAVLATSHTTAAAGDPDTTVTFTVTSTGTLSMTAPDSVDLGSGAVGGTISAALGDVTVTDDRALDAATWTVSASSTNWTTGAGTPVESIPAGDVSYDPGPFTATTGTVTQGAPTTATTLLTPVSPATTGVPVTVVTATGVGDNSATWDPTISVAVPAGAVAGDYVGTLTQSVTAS
jgi:hypothetical protein